MKAFRALGNTASANYFGFHAYCWPQFNHGQYPQIESIKKDVQMDDMGKQRSPDPASLEKAVVTHPDLQIRGTWKKLDVASGPKPRPRMEFSSWIWRGALYVAGGQLQNDDSPDDLWYAYNMGQNRRVYFIIQVSELVKHGVASLGGHPSRKAQDDCAKEPKHLRLERSSLAVHRVQDMLGLRSCQREVEDDENRVEK